jgi:4'-phosphopantetheinyl transferase
VIEIHEINSCISIGILDLALFGTKQNIQNNREKEKAATSVLLKGLMHGKPFELVYTAENKPKLKNSPTHISISHSHDKLAIIKNEKENTGIDIELIRDKVLTVTHKFLNPSELLFAGKDIEKLITLWAAKEALYKVYGLKGIDFKINLAVDPFSGHAITGRVISNGKKKEYAMAKEKIDNYIMVYILNEI